MAAHGSSCRGVLLPPACCFTLALFCVLLHLLPVWSLLMLQPYSLFTITPEFALQHGCWPQKSASLGGNGKQRLWRLGGEGWYERMESAGVAADQWPGHKVAASFPRWQISVTLSTISSWITGTSSCFVLRLLICITLENCRILILMSIGTGKQMSQA